MEMSEDMMGEAAPYTYDIHLFCTRYHPKGVCSSNCGMQHAHWRLSSQEHGLLATQKSQFCGIMPPPVLEIDAGSGGASMISIYSGR